MNKTLVIIVVIIVVIFVSLLFFADDIISLFVGTPNHVPKRDSIRLTRTVQEYDFEDENNHLQDDKKTNDIIEEEVLLKTTEETKVVETSPKTKEEVPNETLKLAEVEKKETPHKSIKEKSAITDDTPKLSVDKDEISDKPTKKLNDTRKLLVDKDEISDKPTKKLNDTRELSVDTNEISTDKTTIKVEGKETLSVSPEKTTFSELSDEISDLSETTPTIQDDKLQEIDETLKTQDEFFISSEKKLSDLQVDDESSKKNDSIVKITTLNNEFMTVYHYFTHRNYENVVEIAKNLYERKMYDLNLLYIAGISAYSLNNEEYAKKFFDFIVQHITLDTDDNRHLHLWSKKYLEKMN